MKHELDSPHERLAYARAKRGFVDKAAFAQAVGVNPTTYRAYENGQNGFAKLAAVFAKKLGVTAEWLLEGGDTPVIDEVEIIRRAAEPPADDIDIVDIHHADLELGMGAVFIDSHVEAEALPFPRKWVQAITYSPPDLLTWARGRGDSMFPTISDGDLVLIDRSQTTVREQDSIWAFTVGDVGSIKRLRVKGDRYVILSDNPSVPADEEPQDFVRIVGRVVFVGAKK